MMKNKNKLILLFLLFLIISACSSNDSSGPALVEISSDGEDLESDKGQEENGDEEDVGEEENGDEETAKFIPPKLPDLPDPALSSSKWNQVNGPFGGTITSIFKSSDGYWVTTTDNSGLSDSNLYLF